MKAVLRIISMLLLVAWSGNLAAAVADPNVPVTEQFTAADGTTTTVTIQQPQVVTESVLRFDNPVLAAIPNVYDQFVMASKMVYYSQWPELFRSEWPELSEMVLPITDFVIPTGTYDVKIPDGVTVGIHGAIILFDCFRDVTIDGQGSTIRFYDRMNGIMFINCERVRLKNLTVDWAIPLAVRGAIRRDAAGKVIFQVTDPVGFDDANPAQVNVLTEYDMENKRFFLDKPWVKFGSYHVPLPYLGRTPGVDKNGIISNLPTYDVPVDWVGYISRNDDLNTLITTGRLAAPTFVAGVAGGGSSFAGITRTDVAQGVRVYGGHDATVENVTLHGSCGTGFGVDEVSGYHLKNCRVMRATPDRLISTGADGIFLGPSWGNTLIESNYVEYTGDDCMNMNNQYSMASNVVPGSRTLELSTRTLTGAGVYRVGDEIVLYKDFLNPHEIGRAIITKVVSASMLELDQPLPVGFASGDVLLNVSHNNAPFIIRNNEFSNTDFYGMRLSSSNGLIRNNHFHDLGQAGIGVEAFPTSTDGPGVQNVIIEDNRLIRTAGCSYGHNYYAEIGAIRFLSCGIITSAMVSRENTTPFIPDYIAPSKNVVIRNNLIDTTAGLGVYIEAADGVDLVNNTFLNINTHGLSVLDPDVRNAGNLNVYVPSEALEGMRSQVLPVFLM